MDERMNENFSKKNSASGGSTQNFQRRNSRAGDFKVSIDFDDDYYNPPKSSASYDYSKGEKFKVNIPSDNQKSEAYPVYEKKSANTASSAFGTSSATAATKSTAAVKKNAPQKIAQTASAGGKATKPATRGSSQSAKTTSAKKTSGSSASPKRKKSKAKKKYDRTKAVLITCVCLIFISVLTITLSSIALSTINDILAINKESGTTVSITIEENETDFESVYNKLCDNGLVKQKLLCKIFCTVLRNYDQYYSSSQKKYLPVKYVPGVYYFDSSDSLEVMLESIKSSSTVSKDTVRITFPEGWSIAQIFEKIEKNNVCTAEKLYANLDIVGKQFDFYEEIESDAERYLKLEGYLYPDTYDFYIGESANSVLKKLFNNFDKKWTEEYDKRAKELGLSVDEVINLAAMIQREAKNSSQMAGISSVLHNRLDDSATYPLLQMNSTKDYISSTKEYGVFTDYYYSLYLEAYNTYSAQGLPPGPICNPGGDAIKAALYPADTNYCFFCHDTDGNIYYAVTASEHQANTQRIVLAD